MAAHSQKGKSRDKTSIFTGKTVRSEAYMGGFCVEMLRSWKKKETGQRKRLLESGTGCVSRWTQAHSFIPQPKIGHLAPAWPWTPRQYPSWGQRGEKLMEGSCSIGALPPATLHGGAGLSLCSESWQGEQGRKGGSGGTFPLDSARAGEQLRSGSGGGFSQLCSR